MQTPASPVSKQFFCAEGWMMDDRRPVRYADAGGVSIAYRVFGEGLLDLVWTPGLVSNVENNWDSPFLAGIVERLTSFSRLMVFDKRGMGLSDHNVGAPTLEERMDDVRAVMDAVGSERAVPRLVGRRAVLASADPRGGGCCACR